ncbi:MAG: competence protein CoiA family protein [Limisphaerales bacterium]
MLCGKRISDDSTVIAYDEEKANGPFACPECDDEVVLHKGRLKVHHFAHKPPTTCSHGKGETEIHRQCKVAIYEGLLAQPHVTKAKLERDLTSVRPDISARIGDFHVAIEVQISALPAETVIHRTVEYATKGIYLLWLAQWTPELDSDTYRPRALERWLHAAYFGRVYYWQSGLTVVPYHFESVQKLKEVREWYEPGGIHQSVGGYSYRLKSIKKPIRGKPLNLATDFIGVKRQEWETKSMSVPTCLLFQDKFPKFMADE